MSAQIIEFKRPEKPVITPTEPKRRIVAAMFDDRFDSFTRYLVNPSVPYEDRVEFINYWREEWKIEPLEVRH